MSTILRIFILLVLSYSTSADAEWIDYSDSANPGNVITFSTSSLQRLDDQHYTVNVFTNYGSIQNVELNKKIIAYQSKTQIQMFGCETADFALGNAELYHGRDATGSKTLINQNAVSWNPIAPKSLQMALLEKFCRSVKN